MRLEHLGEYILTSHEVRVGTIENEARPTRRIDPDREPISFGSADVLKYSCDVPGTQSLTMGKVRQAVDPARLPDDGPVTGVV